MPPLPQPTPEIAGWPTANWAFVAAMLALLVAVASFGLAYLTYWRGGARIKVNATIAKQIVATLPSPKLLEVVQIAVENKGLAPVQVTGVSFLIRHQPKSKNAIVPMMFEHGKLPDTLDGKHELIWAVLHGPIADQVKSIKKPKIRVVVYAAGVGKRRSGWINVNN